MLPQKLNHEKPVNFMKFSQFLFDSGNSHIILFKVPFKVLSIYASEGHVIQRI